MAELATLSEVRFFLERAGHDAGGARWVSDFVLTYRLALQLRAWATRVHLLHHARNAAVASAVIMIFVAPS